MPTRLIWITLTIGICLVMDVGSGRPASAQEASDLSQSEASETPTIEVQLATDTPTSTPTQTNTPVPPTATPTPTATNIPPPTAKPSATPTPTPTVTPVWPTDTPTPTVTWTPTAVTTTCLDSDEPANDYPGAGKVLVINQAISDMTLSPLGDVDFFLLWAKTDRDYQITTGSGNGVDTRLRVFDAGGSQVAANDDYKPGDPGSQVTFRAGSEGWFMVAVDSVTPIDWDCRRYNIKAVDIVLPTAVPPATGTPKPTPTATGTVTPVPDERKPDDYEPNFDFNSAANIGVGQTVELNFNAFPAGSNDIDNDYFRLYAKPGEELLIETNDVAEGLDTNLILFRENGDVITGNDDCQPGERRSCVKWQPDYTGVAYVLAGPVGTIPEAVSGGSRAYKLSVTDLAGGGSSTPAGRPGLTVTPGATPILYGQPLPWKVTPLPGPVPTATVPFPVQMLPGEESTPEVRIRPIAPVPAGPTAPAPQPINLQVMIYYDENNNRAPDLNEGVAGVSVRVLDAASNRLLSQTFTDNQGHATLSVSAVGEVRLSVSYLSYNKAIKSPGGRFEIRVPALRLPSLIP